MDVSCAASLIRWTASAYFHGLSQSGRYRTRRDPRLELHAHHCATGCQQSGVAAPPNWALTEYLGSGAGCVFATSGRKGVWPTLYAAVRTEDSDRFPISTSF